MWGSAGRVSMRRYRRMWLTSLIALVGAALISTTIGPAQATTPNPPRRIVSGWLPYWTTSTSTSTVTANADLFNEVSPFWFSAVSAGSGLAITSPLSQATRNAAGQSLQARGIKMLPTVTDGTKAGVLAAQLKSPKSRATVVKQLVAIADQPYMDGIDLDWENFAFKDGHASWPATRPAWVAFIASLGAQLHARHKWLAVTTPPLYDAGQTISSGYWVYDWAAIAPSIDRLRIMTYDYHTSIPGPIAPYVWVDRVAAFAVSQVPAGKVQLGVAAYGRIWIARRADNSLDITGICPSDNQPERKSREFPSSQVPEILKNRGLSPKIVRWDPVSQERTFTYVKVYSGKTAANKPTSCRVVHEAWYDDDSSAVARARLVYRYHLAGIAQWTIGGEQPTEWSKLRAYARSIAPAPTQLSLSAPLNITYGVPLRLQIRALSAGRALKNVPITVQFAPKGTSRWSLVKRATTNASGNYVIPTTARRSGRYLLKVPGTYTRLASSRELNVRVHSAVALRVSQNSIRPGQNVIVVVGVNPRIKGQRVLRQFFINGKWTTVESSLTNSVGVTIFAFNPTAAKTTLRYRVMTVAKNGYDSGATYFTVTVR